MLANSQAAECVYYDHLDTVVPFLQFDGEIIWKWAKFNRYSHIATFDGTWNNDNLSKFLRSFSRLERVTFQVTSTMVAPMLSSPCEPPNNCPLKAVTIDTTQTDVWPLHKTIMVLLPAYETLEEATITVVHIPRHEPLRDIEPVLMRFKKPCRIRITAEMFLKQNVDELLVAGFEHQSYPQWHKFKKEYGNVTLTIFVRINNAI